jgi:hypothetical protein
MASKLSFGAQQPLSGWDKLGLISSGIKDAVAGFNGEDGQALQGFQQQIQGRQQLAQRQQAMQQVASQITDPQQLAAFQVDPEGYLKSYWEQQKPQTVSEGTALVVNGKPVFTAPKTGISDGFAYRTDPTTGQLSFGAQRPMNYSETQTSQQHDPSTVGGEAWSRVEANKLGQGHLAVDQGQLGVSRGQLGVAQGNLAMRGQELSGQETAGAGLSDTAVDQLAQGYNATHQLPALGMGKTAAAARERILNRAASLQQGGGLDGLDSVLRASDFKAQSAALSKAQQQRQAMETAEQTALHNLDLGIEVAKRGGAAPGVPFLGPAIQAARINGLQDPRATQLKNYLETAANESAKVLSGSTGSQGATDSARKEAHGRINDGMSLSQMLAARESIQKEMAARVEASRQTEVGLHDRIRNGSHPGQAAPPAAGGPKRIKFDAQGNVVQ